MREQRISHMFVLRQVIRDEYRAMKGHLGRVGWVLVAVPFVIALMALATIGMMALVVRENLDFSWLDKRD